MATRPNPHYAGYHYPAEIIVTAVWLYFHFPVPSDLAPDLR